MQLSNGTQATGVQVGKGRGKSAPWWTSKCKIARIEYGEAISSNLRAACVQKLRETILAAKKEHCTQQIEAMTIAADIFKLMRSASPRQAKIPPPLIHEGSLITNPAERATILRDALLARHHETDDLPPCTTARDNRISWENHISEEDVRKYTIGCRNIAPGADGVSVELLEAC
ncbi:hypothetical protein K3495_g2241 [Podosphaera aphanis]|nr:hypothetical protein K3495_g2241 [Podosphaera aphanis]